MAENTIKRGRMAFYLILVSIIIKTLLLPSYRSTDFEVHRNWLAITHSLPINEWYFNEQSIWTLDYPPFFAYFEYFLSYFASLVDTEMVKLHNLDYGSDAVIFFQRFSVIICDLLLAWASYRYLSFQRDFSSSVTVFSLVIFNGGLLLVDHIHFQYNGFLLGILILSIDCAQRGHYKMLALLFSILVLMKHLYAPLAPVVGLYLICNFCLGNVEPARKNEIYRSLLTFGSRFLQLVSIASLSLGLAFGPFIFSSCPISIADWMAPNTSSSLAECVRVNASLQMTQIVKRLFPFGRGLVHAYWAPNIWALYCGIDKFLSIISKGRYGYLVLPFQSPEIAGSDLSSIGLSSTAGLVGEFKFNFLTPISASTSLLLVSISLLPACVRIVQSPDSRTLLRAIVYSSMSTFMLGYHVHEKAILTPLLCQLLLVGSATIPGDFSGQLFLELSTVGIYSLFPLFSRLPELVTKTTIYGVYIYLAFTAVDRIQPLTISGKRNLGVIQALLLIVYLFSEIVHPLWFINPISKTVVYEFLPLMVTSCVSAAIMFWTWIQSLRQLLL